MIAPGECHKTNNAIAILERKYRRYDLRAEDPMSVKKYCRLQLSKNYESFGIIKLNCHGLLIEFKPLFRGTIDNTTVQPRKVILEVINEETTSIILAHNHPSGDVTPSRADIQITETLVKCLYDIGVKVVDHVIASKTDAFSFSEAGLMPDPMAVAYKKRFRRVGW